MPDSHATLIAEIARLREELATVRDAESDAKMRLVSLKEEIRSISGLALQGIHEPDPEPRNYCKNIRNKCLAILGATTLDDAVNKLLDEKTERLNDT